MMTYRTSSQSHGYHESEKNHPQILDTLETALQNIKALLYNVEHLLLYTELIILKSRPKYVSGPSLDNTSYNIAITLLFHMQSHNCALPPNSTGLHNVSKFLKQIKTCSIGSLVKFW